MTIATLPDWLQHYPDTLSASLPDWLIHFRQRHWAAFLKKGLPTHKDERWKYSDPIFAKQHFWEAVFVDKEVWQAKIQQYRLTHGDSILLILMNGYFLPQYSDISELPPNVIALNIKDALDQYPELVKSHWPADVNADQYPFASLNAARFVDGLFFYVPDHLKLDKPIHLLSLVSDEATSFIAQPHHMLVIGNHAKLKWVEDYAALCTQAYMLNIVSHITLKKAAQLEYYKIQTENKNAIHIAHTFIKQMENSESRLAHFSSGSAFARDEVVIKLIESGANCRTRGFYCVGEDNQYIDYHIDIHHAAPCSNSEMLYKGTIDKKSRAVFNGRLYVEKEAQKILAYQANHNILLSNEAEVYSKPELEIYADDVKCKHGASIGQIDQEALFYLRSRGISQKEALAMLLSGFSNEILQGISHLGIRRRCETSTTSLSTSS